MDRHKKYDLTVADKKYHLTDNDLPRRKRSRRKQTLYIGIFVSLVIGLVTGILIGHFGISSNDDGSMSVPAAKKGDRDKLQNAATKTILDTATKITPSSASKASQNDKQTTKKHSDNQDLLRDENPEISGLILNEISSTNIRENLRMLSNMPHIAGSERNHELSINLTDFWKRHGLDQVALTPYDVLLSYPNMSNLNYVALLDENGTEVYKSYLTEPVLTPEENKTGVVPPFLAYSAAGDVTGDIVYVNYGRVEDYITLENATSINVTGKLVLVRYGEIYRGDKVHLAELRGAIGVIIFSDPADYAGSDLDDVYPRDWWLPPTGTQRGTIAGEGDPLTPGYPSISTAYRQPLSESEQYIPGIPSHPIGYGIAVKLMEQLAGDEVPKEWRGGMNVTYRFGGSFTTKGWRTHLMVDTHTEMVTIYNAFGIIKGAVEPDRYVILGNHRDAWVFGAIDPSGGTAIMMEIARVMGELVTSGKWRPRRTIIFCSWGAEEFGLIGSTEWLEQYIKLLGSRTVAYLNVDLAVVGNFSFMAQSTPMLYETLYSATRKVPNPNASEVAAGRKTVYDTWHEWFKPDAAGRPRIDLPASRSDETPFRDRIGVPISDMAFVYWQSGIQDYPLYHSMYETFYAVDRLIDRGFKCHQAMGRVWAEMVRHLADSLILPFNVSDYVTVLNEMADSLLSEFGRKMEQHGINTHLLREAIDNFTADVTTFEHAAQNIDRNNPYAIRLINDQLMQLDRAFLDPEGLPGRHLKKHILLAESRVNVYSGSSFPGLVDLIFATDESDDSVASWEVVKKHFSVILFTIQSAGSTLRDVTNFM